MPTTAENYLQVLAGKLLPGFGFFSPRGPLDKRLNVNKTLRRVRISFSADTRMSFAFPLVEFCGADGKILPKNDLIQSVTVNSLGPAFKGDDLVKSTVSGKVFRSRKVRKAWVDIVFHEPQMISQIMLGNRVGLAGGRARGFELRGFYKRREVYSFQNNTEKARQRVFRKLYQILERPLPEFGVDLEEECTAVRRALVSGLENNRKLLSARTLGDVLPIYQRQPELAAFSETILATMLAKIIYRKQVVSTKSFEPFGANILHTAGAIERVVDQANERLSNWLEREVKVMAGKHAFQESRLVVHKASYLEMLDQAFPALVACGVTPILAYGSLLGAVREGGFLAHDDDIDVLYYDGSKSEEEALSRRADLVKAMEKHGFKLSNPFRNANFHLSNGKAKVDLFPCWEEGIELQVMQRYPRYLPVPKSVILPPSKAKLYGHSYAAPADQKAFLGWRYGPTWETPDPYHEWPWPLEN